jgi:light-regulated signal transduction histidine kinase (bacteriophytochrome)
LDATAIAALACIGASQCGKKCAPPGSRIEVAAARENGFVAVRVFDERDGIPDADLERIFDKFYRVRRADRQRVGTGLGFAICRGFVEAMRGRTPRTGPAGAVRFSQSDFSSGHGMISRSEMSIACNFP